MLSLLTDSGTLHKQEMKIKAKLSTTCLSVGDMPPNAHKTPLQRLRHLLIPVVYRNLCSFMNGQANQENISVATYDKEFRVYRISSGKALHK